MARREVARAEAVTPDRSGALADGGKAKLKSATPIKHILFRHIARKTLQFV